LTQASSPRGVHVRHPNCVYVDGRWLAPEVPRWIEVVSPDTEQVVARVAEGGGAEIDAAVAAARRAFDKGPWPRLPAAERAVALRKLAERLRPREPELAAAWTAQIGALASMAGGMAASGTRRLETLAALTERFAFESRVESPAAPVAMVVREPVGVVAAICPWNGPYPIMAAKVGAALAAGCTVVMKPSPETPLEAYIIAEAADDIDLPPGVLNLVCADREGSDRLVCHPDVDKVSFTGSTAVGRRIAGVCAERMARCTLELGGKSAAIVLDDYPIEAAGKTLARTITLLSGQICAMLSRVIVSRNRHDQLAEAVAREMTTIRVGRSDDPAAEMGPIAMRRQLARVEGYIAAGKAEGAELLAGGGRPAHLNEGFFLEPTLFAGVDNASTIAREEIFGPVLSLIPCDGEEDAVRIANESDYGLNGAVFTHDPQAAYRVARALRAGNVAQNAMRLDLDLPFGGFKQSGLGREGGEEGFMSYLETKTLLLETAP
jgi:aldehyde dehydrogenase (NAD+)